MSEYASYKTEYLQSIKQQDKKEEKKSCNQLMLRQEKGSLLSPFAAGIYTEILKCTLILTFTLVVHTYWTVLKGTK